MGKSWLVENLRNNFDKNVTFRYYFCVKFIITVLFIWKILSRGFENVAFWPKSVLSGYPIDINPPDYTLIHCSTSIYAQSLVFSKMRKEGLIVSLDG